MTNDAQPTQALYLVPTGSGVGLTSVSMGLVRALDRNGLKPAFFKPVAQLFRGDTGPERSTYVIRNSTELSPPDPIPYAEVDTELTKGNMEQLLERIMGLYQEAAGDADVVVVEGLISQDEFEHATLLNQAIARTLDASFVLVGAPRQNEMIEFDHELRNTAADFGGLGSERVLGAIANFVNAPRDDYGQLQPDLDVSPEDGLINKKKLREDCPVFHSGEFKLLGCVPWLKSMAQSRVVDIAHHLNARMINKGEVESRRIHKVFLCARTVDHITHVFQANALLLIPIDRMDLFLAACMGAAEGIALAGVVLTSATGEPSSDILKLCRRGLESGLPVMAVNTDSYTTATLIPRMNTEVPIDDIDRIETGMNYVASHVDKAWVKSLLGMRREIRLSPAAFRYQMVKLARNAAKRVVLPEGDEPRTLQAVIHCHHRQIAHCILLADPDKVKEVAENHGLDLPSDVEIINPLTIRDDYIDTLIDLRKHKGMDRSMAASLLEDNVMLGTLMLQTGKVDGLVSGAVHTTAQTVRPALQLIKTRPGNRVVSSLFFMLLPDQVVIYADCAINENPDAETLAEIALQSADSARAFGIDPRVAMISYSTGQSGSGSEVEKVRQATAIAHEKQPELPIDGPLQYDAASTASVAKTKAPDSEVAGRANVFIFPDLNTGNTTYKAVQRSAKVVSIGPMLQGLNKPVNDLSRGALVEDIIYTIALTAIQAGQNDADS